MTSLAYLHIGLTYYSFFHYCVIPLHTPVIIIFFHFLTNVDRVGTRR